MKQKNPTLNILNRVDAIDFGIPDQQSFKRVLNQTGKIMLYQLLELSEENLSKKLGVTKKHIEFLKEFLSRYNLRLGMSPNETREYVKNIFNKSN